MEDVDPAAQQLKQVIVAVQELTQLVQGFQQELTNRIPPLEQGLAQWAEHAQALTQQLAALSAWVNSQNQGLQDSLTGSRQQGRIGIPG